MPGAWSLDLGRNPAIPESIRSMAHDGGIFLVFFDTDNWRLVKSMKRQGQWRQESIAMVVSGMSGWDVDNKEGRRVNSQNISLLYAL